MLSVGVCIAFCPHSGQLGDSRACFLKCVWGWKVFRSSPILRRSIRLANSRRIRKAPEAEESGWDFSVSLPCLHFLGVPSLPEELGSDLGPRSYQLGLFPHLQSRAI